MEVVEGVVRIETPLVGRRNDVYAFVGSQRTVLFDTGVDGVAEDFIVPALAEVGVGPGDVSHVVVSHCDVDHFGGLAEARKHFPAAVFLAHGDDAGMMQDFGLYLQGRGRSFVHSYGLDEPEADLAWVREVTHEAPIDALVCGGERLDLGDRELRLLHVPGHSRGHLAISDPDRSLVAVSDAVLGSAVPDSDGRPLFPPTYRHVDAYLDSIEHLRGLAASQLVTAHYGSFEGQAVSAFLDESEAFCRSLARSVAQAMPGTDRVGLTLAEFVDLLLPTVGDWPKDGRRNALAFPVCGHLEELVRVGRLALDATTSPYRFRSL